MVRKNSVPNYSELITVTYAALKALGGSGKNDEINNKAAEILGLSDDVLEVPHLNSSSLSEINYRLAWARTLLKRSGAIANSARAVWAISPSFSDVAEVDGAAINKAYHKLNAPKKDIPADADPEDMPEEVRPWRKKLYEVLIHMDPYAFERLTQRVLRECGFTQVEVTKKSGDGGIDGTGKLRINGIFSFNIALGQFTRNYTQTVKRAADNKRRYAPGWVHSTCLLRGFPKGAAPHLAHDFAEQSVVCYTLCRRCPENTVAAGEGKGI